MNSVASKPRPQRVAITLCVFAGVFVCIIISLRIFGLLRPFNAPTGSMAPAVSSGDHFIVENISYLLHEPRRGDVAVFKTDGLLAAPQGEIFIKRIAGKPREYVELANGKVLINNMPIALSNALGEISYAVPPNAMQTNMLLPDRAYYVIGDNSSNSLDSRFFGAVPRANIKGRAVFCYWPPDHFGLIK